MAGRVEGKVALVTGGAMGLGKADCERLAEEGAKVVVTDIDLAKAQAVADAIGGHAFAQDVRDEARWQEIIGEVERLHGRLDILVNNAGNVIFESIEDCSADNFRLHMAIHVEGTFFGCKYALPLMKKSGGGSIVNMASSASLMGYGTIVAYTAAKGAIRSMTKSIAMHCQDEGYGIRCSALDVSVQAQVLNLLNDLKKEFGFTVIFISHDLSVVRYISDRIMVMNKGKIEESGPADAIYYNPQSDYTKRLITSIPKGIVV